MDKDYLYNKIANNIAEQIRNGALKAGDKLPSVRMLCKEYNVGMNTAKRVFMELETLSLIVSKPQSGYFVCKLFSSKLPLTETSRPLSIANDKEPDEFITKVYSSLGNGNLTLFSIGVPSPNLLPLTLLKKEILVASRELTDCGTGYETLYGNNKLRRAPSLAWGGCLKEDDLITTNGGINALSLCLMAVSKPGDTVAVESPCYPGIFQLIISLGLKVLELPTHPIYGIDIKALKETLPMIDKRIEITRK